MPLAAGTKLGPYEIVDPIGAGGMGEVYRARDTRLNRDVAIKVLPASFSEDADRLRRFQLEAQSASALNHPNILAIFDIGTFERSPYLVSELLEGESLRARLERGKIPENKAVDFARQIAAGLAAAHAKGIVHRDIKPENLFVTKDGRVKILDFGLAKVTGERAKAGEATRTVTSTTPGIVMGTAAYMSPEQARGQAVDHRTDIFSFGCVLCEMLTGERAFTGATHADVTSAILTKEPVVAGKMPPAVARIVTHCLEKSPEERLQSARDIVFALEGLSQQESGPEAPASAPRRIWMPLLLGASLLACAALAYLDFRPAAEVKFHRLTFRRGRIHAARFVPDGHTMVYSAQWEDEPFQVFAVRDDSPESRPLGLPGTGLFGVSSTSQLALALDIRPATPFVDEGTLAVAPFSGGAPRSLLNDVRFADWSPDGSQLAIVRETPKAWQIELPAGHVLHQNPSGGYISDLRFSRDGKHLAFLEHPSGNSAGYVVVIDRDGREKQLTSNFEGDASGLAWSAKGDEVWFTATKIGARRELWAVTLSGRLRRVASYPVSTYLQDIEPDGRVLLLATLEDRSKIYFRGANDARERELSWLDYAIVRDVSPDGKQIMFDESGEGAGADASVYIRGTDGSAAVKLGSGSRGELSADGQWILSIESDSHGLIFFPAGTGETKHIPFKDYSIERAYLLPGGRELIISATAAGHGSRIYRLNRDGSALRPITPEGIKLHITGASPDGKLVPAQYAATGKYALWPTSGGDPVEAIGLLPKEAIAGWTADSKFLYTYTPGGLPVRLFRLDFRTGRKELLKEIIPSDRAGVSAAGVVKVTPDGKAYAYSQVQSLHELQLIEGLK
jgi:Tol biopolymer transport system component